MSPPEKKQKTNNDDKQLYKIPCIDEHERILRCVLQKHNKNLSTYSSDEGYYVNRCLREGSVQQQVLTLYESMMGAFDASKPFTAPAEQHVHLYRGLQCLKPGTVLGESFIDLGFVSTSTKMDVAATFASPADQIMVIMLVPGVEYKILPIQGVSTMSNEYEVLLPPGGYFHFCGKDSYYNYLYYPNKPDDVSDNIFVDPPNAETNVLNQLNKLEKLQGFDQVLAEVKDIVAKRKLDLTNEQCEDICYTYLFS